MATTYVVADTGAKNNHANIINAGTQPTGSDSANLTLSNAGKGASTVNKVTQAVTTASSGNLGTLKVISGGTFQNYTEGDYIYPLIAGTIAGSANTVLDKPNSQQINRPIAFTESNRRINITSWNAVTGAATYGGNRGDAIDFGTDDAARPTRAVPGELAFLIGGATPSQLNYAAR